MKWKQIPIQVTALLCLMSGVIGLCGANAMLSWRNKPIQDKLQQVDALASRYYVGDLDQVEVGDYAVAGYIAGLDDPWSVYIPAANYQAYQLSSDGQTCGIGVTVSSTEEEIRVSAVYADSPAEQAGIRRGDYILGAGDLTCAQDGADAVTNAIRGEAGTDVTIQLRTETGETKTLTLTRTVVVQTMATGEMLTDTIGYLKISSFHGGLAAQFETALNELIEQGAKALVLDVRHNGGGYVREMSDALDLLLPEGNIVSLRTKDGKETVYRSDADCIDLPLAVLVDQESISAAELFAAVLQEYDRADVVGTHTTGKGRAQQTFELSDGSAVSISVEEYFTPNGENLADTGIAPDYEVAIRPEDTANFFFMTQEQDAQLQKAITLLS